MRSSNNTRNMLGRPNPYRKNRQAGTLDDLMFDMDNRRHTSFRFQNYQNFITDRPSKFDVRYRQKHSWCALDEETGELDYLTEDGPSPAGGRRQSTSSVGSRTTNGDRDSLLALARESSSSGSGAGGGEEDDSMPLSLSGRKDSGILTPPRRSSLAAQGLMSPIKPSLEGASTPKPSSGRSWVAPQFTIDPENRASRVLHEDASSTNDHILSSATPEAEDGASMVDIRGDALSVLPTASNVATASASPTGNAITLSPIPSNRQLLQAVGRSPASRSTGSSGRRSSTSAYSFGTSSTRSAGSCVRRSGGGGSNGGSSGSSRVSGGGALGSGVAVGNNTVVVQTIKPPSGGGVMEGGQGGSEGSSTLKAACVDENSGDVNPAAGGSDMVKKGNPGREPSYGTVSQQAGRGSMLASNGGEDGGGEFPRKSEVSTYFSSIASGATWSDTAEVPMATLGDMPEAMGNRGKEVGKSQMEGDDSGVVLISSADPSLLVGLPRVDDGKLEHDKERRLGVAGDLEAVIAELSRRKSSLAWEDGEGASVVGEVFPDETSTDEEMELHQSERTNAAEDTLKLCDNAQATASPETATVDEKKEPAPSPAGKCLPLPKNEETLASPSLGPAAAPASILGISEAFVKTSETVTGASGAKADMSGYVSKITGSVFYAEKCVVGAGIPGTSAGVSRASTETSGTGAEIFVATAETARPGAEISRAAAETTGPEAGICRAAAQKTGPGAEIDRAFAETSVTGVEVFMATAETTGPDVEVSKTAAQTAGAGPEISKTFAEAIGPGSKTFRSTMETSGAIASPLPAAATASLPPFKVDPVSVKGPEATEATSGLIGRDEHAEPRAAVVATAAAAMAAATARSPIVAARARATVAAKKRTNQRASRQAANTMVCEGTVEAPASRGTVTTAASTGAVKTPTSKGSPEKMVSEGTVKTPISRAAVKMSTSGGVVRTPGSGAATKLLSCKEADKLSASKGAVKATISDEVVKTTALDKATGRVATEAAVKQRSHRPRYDAPTASSVARAHGVSGSGGGTGKSTTQDHGRQHGRGREERMSQGKSHLGRRSLSAPPARSYEELACGIDAMISDFVTPSDLVTSIKERAKGAPPLSGVPGDAYHGNETASPSPVGVVPAGPRVKRGAVKNQKQEKTNAARNASGAVVKPVQVSVTDDERSPRPGSTRSGRGGGRSGMRGSSVEATRSVASTTMPPPSSRGVGAQGKARKGKYQVKDSFNRLKGWIHGGFAGGSDRKNNAHGGVTPSARGSARKAAIVKAPKGRRGAPSAAGVSTIEPAKSVGDSKSLKVKTVAGRVGGARHGSTVSPNEPAIPCSRSQLETKAIARDQTQPSANPSSSAPSANSGLEKGGETLELGHMTVVELVRERGRTMERPLQAASAGSSPSPSPSPSPPASPFQPTGEGSAPEQIGVAPRRVKAAGAQGSSTPTLAPSSGRSKTASVARSLGASVPPLSAACRTVSYSPRAPVGRFRSPMESTVPVRTPRSGGGEMRPTVDGLAAGGRGREGAATTTVGSEAGASGARSQRVKKSTRVRGESTANGDTKWTAAKENRSRKAGK